MGIRIHVRIGLHLDPDSGDMYKMKQDKISKRFPESLKDIVVTATVLLALAGPVSCLAKVHMKLIVSPFHVNPSRCTTLANLVVRTEQCL